MILQRRGLLMKKLLGAALSVFLLSSCSFIFVRRVPPTQTPQTNIRCTTSLAPPVIDGILAAYWIASLGIAAFAPERLEAQGIDPTAASVLYGVFLVNRGLSTAYGVVNTSKCKAALARPIEPQPVSPLSPSTSPVDPR
jgi:hypothetical protein